MTEQQEKEIMDTLRLGFGFSDAYDAFDKITSILSPLPHQDGASAEDVLDGYYCLSIEIDDDCPVDVEEADGSRIALAYVRTDCIKAMHQFAKSEVDKIVAEKDREIQKLYDKISMDSEIYEIQEDVISATNSKVSLLESQLSAANEKIAHLEQGISNWVRVSNERQEELNEAKRRVKELEERNLEFREQLNEIDAWFSFNKQPSVSEIMDMRKSIQKRIKSK